MRDYSEAHLHNRFNKGSSLKMPRNDVLVMLSQSPGWQMYKEMIEKTIRGYATEKKVKAADIRHPLRAAITGKTVSPGIFELMEYLGREECLKRIAAAEPL